MTNYSTASLDTYTDTVYLQLANIPRSTGPGYLSVSLQAGHVRSQNKNMQSIQDSLTPFSSVNANWLN